MNKAAGFTLVEVLVAMAITAIIGLAGSSLLLQTFAAGAQLREKSDNIQQLELARALLQDDLGQIVSRIDAPMAGTRSSDGFLFSLTRSGWPIHEVQDARSDLQPVSYRFENKSVVRRAWLRANPVATTPFVDRTILSDVEHVRIRFYRDGAWRADWPQSLGGKPDLVEVEIEFGDLTSLKQTFCVGSDA